jgi:hypothetical protein
VCLVGSRTDGAVSSSPPSPPTTPLRHRLSTNNLRSPWLYLSVRNSRWRRAIAAYVANKNPGILGPCRREVRLQLGTGGAISDTSSVNVSSFTLDAGNWSRNTVINITAPSFAIRPRLAPILANTLALGCRLIPFDSYYDVEHCRL